MASRKSGRRAALGGSPFSAAAAYLNDAEEETPHPTRGRGRSRRPERARPAREPEHPRRRKKVRGTFQMTEELLQAARNTVVALSGPPHRMTLASLVEAALTREIRQLEKQHNAGESFPDTDEPLRQGRPIGS